MLTPQAFLQADAECADIGWSSDAELLVAAPVSLNLQAWDGTTYVPKRSFNEGSQLWGKTEVEGASLAVGKEHLYLAYSDQIIRYDLETTERSVFGKSTGKLKLADHDRLLLSGTKLLSTGNGKEKWEIWSKDTSALDVGGNRVLIATYEEWGPNLNAWGHEIGNGIQSARRLVLKGLTGNDAWVTLCEETMDDRLPAFEQVYVSEDGTKIFAWEGTAGKAPIRGWNCRWGWSWNELDRRFHGDSLAVSPDGHLVAILGDKEVEVWNIDKYERVGSINPVVEKMPAPAVPARATCLAFSPDSKRLAVGLRSGTVVVLGVE